MVSNSFINSNSLNTCKNNINKNNIIHDNFIISCFNTHGIKSNLVYIDQILNDCEILFITWLLESEFFLLKNFNVNFLSFNKSDMLYKPNYESPYGGRSWFINKNLFTYISVVFYNERISILTFDKCNNYFALIGVYLPFFNNSNVNLFEFESSIVLINELSISYFKKNFTVIILGDFNCDLSIN
jgi:hypothetical protein